MSEEDDGEGIGEALKKLFPPKEYPPELWTARRAEYTTGVKKMRKPGCPFMILILVLPVVVLFRIFV